MIRATETQRHGDEFVERNAWLHLLLGLESWGRRFDALLDAYAPADAPVDAEVRETDDRLIEFVLGLASMRATLGRLLVGASSDAPAEAGAPVAVRSSGAAWLR